MKVRLLVFIVITAISAILFWRSKFSNELSDGFLSANVEALADVEHGKYVRCLEIINSDPADTVLYCGTCTEIPGRFVGAMSNCKNKK